ncbi:MAG: pyridoxal phosphate-dependent aminotransferase [SAR202 cluster bacterium]|nr:pyridoxal phosphate-dependent aminotransferase [SAR202 cluster bacterium]
MSVAERMSRLGTETAFEVLGKARALEAKGQDIVHLEIGEPDFDTPKHITDAAIQALKDGHTHYGPTAGIPELREAIARNVSKTRGIKVSPDQVVVTPGGKPIMFFAILALAQKGDEVLYPNPSFPIYESMIRFSEAKPVPVRLIEKDGYRMDIEDLASKLSPKTRLVILNSPQNPCGSVMTKGDIAALAELLGDREDIYVLSDEIYKDIIYSGRHHSIAAEPGVGQRTMILDGFSKSYAMTGWRLGYGVFPPAVVPHIVKLAANSVSCAPTFTQRAAVAALEGSQEPVKKMAAEFRARRDLIVKGLNSIPGINCPEPQGAFYAFPSVKGTGIGSLDFQERGLKEAGVALLNGAAFGKYGEGFIRLSYANSQQNIKKAIDRLDGWVRKNGKKTNTKK